MSDPTPLAAEIVSTLVEQHRRLLAFLERRVGSKAAAEEILQAAFLRHIENADTVRNDEGVLSWFDRLLRTALIDRHRRQVAHAGISLEVPDYVDSPELRAAVRTCVSALLGTLKSDNEELLRRVDLTDPAGAGASESGVRLHRARLALRQRVLQACGTCVEHGCLDCECKRPA